MDLSKVLLKFCVSLMVILMAAYVFVLYADQREQLITNLRLLQKSFRIQATQRPVNNLTYPAFRHLLAPPYPYPYKFIFSQQHKCKGRSPFLVLMVLGGVSDFESRNAIRDTWGNVNLYDVDVVRIFLLGLPQDHPDGVQKMLQRENTVYGDIVQQDFMDTYYNLTLKTLMGLEWVTKFCPTASYVMKIDNDMFLNVDYLVHKLLKPQLPVRQNYFTGYIVSGTGPLRAKGYKWYVPEEIYPNSTYPPYCAGPGYLLSADMSKKIYDISQVIRVIPMEDAFMGICLHELRIPPTAPPPGIFNGHRIEYGCAFQNLITVHHYNKDELRKLWGDFWKKKLNGCNNTDHL